MTTDELTAMLQAERAVRSSPQALEQGLSRLLTSLAGHAAPLPIATGTLKLGWTMASKWLAIGFVVGLGGAGAAAQAWAPRVLAVAAQAPSAPVEVRPVGAAPATREVPVQVAAQPPERSERAVASAPTEVAASATTFDAELRLITAAKSELDRGRPHLAAAWLDDHAQRFPAGVFAMDREALRILASCTQRQNVALARDFAARHPGSPMVERLLRACGKPEAAGPSASARDFPK